MADPKTWEAWRVAMAALRPDKRALKKYDKYVIAFEAKLKRRLAIGEQLYVANQVRTGLVPVFGDLP